MNASQGSSESRNAVDQDKINRQHHVDTEEQRRQAREQNQILERQAQEQLRIQQQAVWEAERQTEIVEADIEDRRDERQKVRDSSDAVFELSQREPRIRELMAKYVDWNKEECAPAEIDKIIEYMSQLEAIDRKYIPDLRYKQMLAALQKNWSKAYTQPIRILVGRRQKAEVVEELFELQRNEERILGYIQKFKDATADVDTKRIVPIVADYFREIKAIDEQSLPDAQCEAILQKTRQNIRQHYYGSINARRAVVQVLIREQFMPLLRLSVADEKNLRKHIDSLQVICDDLKKDHQRYENDLHSVGSPISFDPGLSEIIIWPSGAIGLFFGGKLMGHLIDIHANGFLVLLSVLVGLGGGAVAGPLLLWLIERLDAVQRKWRKSMIEKSMNRYRQIQQAVFSQNETVVNQLIRKAGVADAADILHLSDAKYFIWNSQARTWDLDKSVIEDENRLEKIENELGLKI